MATYPLNIWTVREQFENGYTVTKWCPTCKTWAGELDLAGLVAAGYGDKPPLQIGLRHRDCRTLVLLTIHPPPTIGGYPSEASYAPRANTRSGTPSQPSPD